MATRSRKPVKTRVTMKMTEVERLVAALHAVTVLAPGPMVAPGVSINNWNDPVASWAVPGHMLIMILCDKLNVHGVRQEYQTYVHYDFMVRADDDARKTVHSQYDGQPVPAAVVDLLGHFTLS